MTVPTSQRFCDRYTEQFFALRAVLEGLRGFILLPRHSPSPFRHRYAASLSRLSYIISNAAFRLRLTVTALEALLMTVTLTVNGSSVDGPQKKIPPHAYLFLEISVILHFVLLPIHHLDPAAGRLHIA